MTGAGEPVAGVEGMEDDEIELLDWPATGVPGVCARAP